MLFIAELELRDYDGDRKRTVMVQADSPEEAEIKVYQHFDALLIKIDENGKTVNLGGEDYDISILDIEITECIR